MLSFTYTKKSAEMKVPLKIQGKTTFCKALAS